MMKLDGTFWTTVHGDTDLHHFIKMTNQISPTYLSYLVPNNN